MTARHCLFIIYFSVRFGIRLHTYFFIVFVVVLFSFDKYKFRFRWSLFILSNSFWLIVDILALKFFTIIDRHIYIIHLTQSSWLKTGHDALIVIHSRYWIINSKKKKKIQWNKWKKSICFYFDYSYFIAHFLMRRHSIFILSMLSWVLYFKSVISDPFDILPWTENNFAIIFFPLFLYWPIRSALFIWRKWKQNFVGLLHKD